MWTCESTILKFMLWLIVSRFIYNIDFTDNYSCIGVNFHLNRMNGFYFIHMYVPSVLIVMLSWISFWLDIEATAARISLGILTVLAMTTQNKFTGVQHVSYVTAMNVWTAASLAFVFLGVIEYAYINVKTRKHVRRSLNRATSNLSMNGNNPILNGSIYSISKKDTNCSQVAHIHIHN